MLTETQRITQFILIAGAGELPLRLVKSALGVGVRVVVLSLSKSNRAALANLVDTYAYSPIEVFPMLDKIKELGIKQLCFIGKVPKLDFFRNIHKLDKRLFAKIMELKDLNDDSLHCRIVDFLENENALEVIKQNIFLQDLFPQEQIFTKREPNAEELEEIKYGMAMARGIAALDIGQTVVVHNKAVIAVEAIEGTNHCIKRSIAKLGFFASKKSLIVCKVSKPNQDERFDMPTIGYETIKTIPANSIVAMEAGKTFFVDQAKSIELANKKNISIIARHLG